jgi:hypothetical protein
MYHFLAINHFWELLQNSISASHESVLGPRLKNAALFLKGRRLNLNIWRERKKKKKKKKKNWCPGLTIYTEMM